jgi:hypothetical protein
MQQKNTYKQPNDEWGDCAPCDILPTGIENDAGNRLHESA